MTKIHLPRTVEYSSVPTKDLLTTPEALFVPTQLILLFTTNAISTRKTNKLFNMMNVDREKPIFFRNYVSPEGQISVCLNVTRLITFAQNSNSCSTLLEEYFREVLDESEKLFPDQTSDIKKLIGLCDGLSQNNPLTKGDVISLHEKMTNSLLLGRIYTFDGLNSVSYEKMIVNKLDIDEDFMFTGNYFAFSGKLPERKTVSFVCAVDDFTSKELSAVTDVLNDSLTNIKTDGSVYNYITLPHETAAYTNVRKLIRNFQ